MGLFLRKRNIVIVAIPLGRDIAVSISHIVISSKLFLVLYFTSLPTLISYLRQNCKAHNHSEHKF